MLYHYLALAVLALVVVLSVAECPTEETTTEKPLECSRLLTFNTVMLPDFGNLTERRTRVPNALLAQNADVYCLQEYWQECDMEVLLEILGPVYQWHYSALHEQVGELHSEEEDPPAPCSQSEINYYYSNILACAHTEGCLALLATNAVAGAECIAKSCSSLIQADNITADCGSCLIVYSVLAVDGGVSRCTAKENSCVKRFNPPGLVLLSKRPISTAKYVEYFPDHDFTFQRGYLEAEVETVGKVLCTHMTYETFRYLEYDSPFQNYSAQKFAEIKHLKDTFANVDHVLMGDVNMGPSVFKTRATRFSSAHYDRLISAGYRDPYRALDGRCTFCRPVDGVRDLVDQVFLKGLSYTAVDAVRVFDDLANPLSDHYGVQVNVCRNSTA